MDKNDIKILYVDDEDSWRVVFERNFKGIFEVLTARNAEEGWEILRKHSGEIGVIVSDQRMPGRPGIELLKQARAYYPKIVRIITTGFSDSTIAVHATNQGAVYHYISKPWNGDELASIVRRAMDFYLLRRERDNLLERKLSTIQRKDLESKLQCLLVFAVSNQNQVDRTMEALGAYLDSIQEDPGRITNVKRIFRQSQSEIGSLLLNLTLVKKLNELPDELFKLPDEGAVEVRNVLLNIRDECSQMIYSVRNTHGSKLDDLSGSERFIARKLLNLIDRWVGDQQDEKLLEVSEVRPQGEAEQAHWFRVKICNYSDPSDLHVCSEDPCFNGINLDADWELGWLLFLFTVYHFGGAVKPLHLSKERMVFELGEFDPKKASKQMADSIVAELVHKFEAWNYSNNLLPTDDQ